MKRFMKSFITVLALVVIVSTMLVGCGSAQSQDPDWRRVAVFKGDSNQQTKVFHIKSDLWRIKWTVESGWFKAAVVRPDGFGGHWEHNVTNYVDLTSPFATEGIDEVKYAGPGDYYLLIEAEAPFTIIIEEKR